MSPALTLRRAKPEPDDVVDEQTEDLPPVATATDQVVSTWSTRLATVGLFTCLALGPVGTAGAAYAILLNQQTTGPVAVAAPVEDLSDERAAVGEFAQRVVTVWLTSTQDNPDALQALVKDAAVVTLSNVPFDVSDVDVAGITPGGGVGTWSVLVAATVTDASEQTARRYYQVPVHVDNAGALSALALPAAVAAPVVVGGSTGAYRTHIAMNSPVADTVTQFLSAYLTGAGDVFEGDPRLDDPARHPAALHERQARRAAQHHPARRGRRNTGRRRDRPRAGVRERRGVAGAGGGGDVCAASDGSCWPVGGHGD